MKLPKINISTEKTDLNVKFYFFLKYLLKAKLTENQILHVINVYKLFPSKNTLTTFKDEILKEYSSKTKRSKEQKELFLDIFEYVQDEISLETLVFSLKLISIKDLLLAEAKVKRISSSERLNKLSPLSLEYDKITVFDPYAYRVNGALLCLMFFDYLDSYFISQDTDNFMKELSNQAKKLLDAGIEPNQIFLLLFNESMNQSITSNIGSNYENRIKSVLLNIGIPEESISKKHDAIDSSTEFDFFFRFNKRSYGISAKRTLRERYKQFIKTAQMTPIDVMIEITLGTDLTEEKVNAIINHGVYLFVSDEVYTRYSYLQNNEKVFSCNDLLLTTLEKL